MEKDLVKMRKFCVRKYGCGWSGNDIARELQVPRRTVYEWIKKYAGKECLANKPTRVKDNHVDDHTRRYVLRLREKFNWGPSKVEGFIKVNRPEKITPLSHNKIYDLFVEAGVNNKLDYIRRTWGKKRFAREHSNTLWQTDFKLLDNDNWICTYLDDHSRFVTNGKEFSENPTTEIALEIFMKASKKYGFPEQVLTDQGSEFYCAPKIGKKQGISTFTQTLNELGIQHIIASKRRPTTTGKIEAFHKGIQLEAPSIGLNYKKYLKYWNYKRPHQEIKYQFPATLYFKDFKNNISASNLG